MKNSSLIKRSIVIRQTVWIAGLVLFATQVFAQDNFAEMDTAQIVGGGHIAGKLSSKESGYVMTLDDEFSLFFPKARVHQIKPSTDRTKYRANASKPGDAEHHYQLAIWCKTNRLYPQRQYHMQRAIALDKNHSKARAALGYVKDKQTGDWILFETQQRNRGLVFSDGTWQLPEAVFRKRMQRDANIAAKQWIKDIQRLLKMSANRNNKKSEEAMAELKAIKDPNAAGAVAELLIKSRDGSQSQALRLLWVRLLGRFRNSVSVKTLVECGMKETDDVIREAAMEQLAEYGASSAVATYLPIIKSDKHSNQLVRRALRGLSYFPDRELWSSYIDGLITMHKQKVQAGPAIQAGQVNGQGGLNMGRKKEPPPVAVKNAGALTLLKMIAPNVDYNYDEQAWREHFANQLTAFQGDLRRDP